MTKHHVTKEAEKRRSAQLITNRLLYFNQNRTASREGVVRHKGNNWYLLYYYHEIWRIFPTETNYSYVYVNLPSHLPSSSIYKADLSRPVNALP